MAEKDSILRPHYRTEFGSEKVEYIWEVHDLTFFPSTVADYKSSHFSSSKIDTTWCLVLRNSSGSSHNNAYYDDYDDYYYSTQNKNTGSAFSFMIELISSLAEKVRAVTRLSALYGKQQIALFEAKQPVTFKKGDEWGPLQLTSAMLDKYSENKIIVKCEISVLTEKVNIISSNHIQSPKCSLGSDLEQMLNTKELCDVTLKIGEQEVIYEAHKVILSARSPVFRAMFNTDMKENRESCFVRKKIDPNDFKEVLRYLYTGKCKLHGGIAERILHFAHEYQLSGLKELCENAMVQEISIENVVALAMKAYQFDCKTLKSLTTNFIQRNLKKVARTNDWEKYKRLNPEFFLDLMCEIAEIKCDK